MGYNLNLDLVNINSHKKFGKKSIYEFLQYWAETKI